jgi:general stress protein YciG
MRRLLLLVQKTFRHAGRSFVHSRVFSGCRSKISDSPFLSYHFHYATLQLYWSKKLSIHYFNHMARRSTAKKSNRGFRAMKDKKRQREIASAGGKAAHEKGTAHTFSSAEAKRAGRKGGRARSKKRASRK